jgi:anaerobic magnesium-protoporphyrin IX monomethyl ester cyclase
MKILLINPPSYLFGIDQPPLGILYVAGALRRAGYNVEVRDLQIDRPTVEKTIEWLRSRDYDVLGIGGITSCYPFVKNIVNALKATDARPIIIGGVIASAAELLLQKTGVDAICLEEGEVASVQLLDAIRDKTGFDNIKGIAFKKNGVVVKTEPQPHIQPLDSIPFPPFDLIEMSPYLKDPRKDRFFKTNPPAMSAWNGEKLLNIKTARGCINRCTFCYRHFSIYRQHSVDYVINFLKYLMKEYNIRYFRFGDELFTANKKWIMNFTGRLLSEKLGIFYHVHGVRADTVDQEMMQQLKISGCVAVFFGFESGSQKILDEMNKRTVVDDNINAALIAKKAGLDYMAQVIIGFPGESPQTVKETTSFLKSTEVPPDRIGIGFATAFPGTWLYEHARELGMIPDEDAYLSRDELVYTHKVSLNFTKYSDKELYRWADNIINGVRKKYYLKHGPFPRLVYAFLPYALRKLIKTVYKRIFFHANS